MTEAHASVAGSPWAGYLFVYFTGDTRSGEHVFFALSTGNDALHWRALNRGEPLLTSTRGTEGARDPFIVRRHDGLGFVLLATDLSIGSGTGWADAVINGSRNISIWTSHDLVRWSDQRHITIAQGGAGCAWAPEAVWDAASTSYRVIWTSARTGPEGVSGHLNVWTSVTPDFLAFSEPSVWIDRERSVLDATVIRAGDAWHRFTKDEGSTTGCSDILHERSRDPDAFPATAVWEEVSRCVGTAAGLGPVEGPFALQSNDGDVNGSIYYLFVDEYGEGRGYIPLVTADIENPNWTVADRYEMPPNARHGSIIPVTEAEMTTLLDAYA